MLLFLGVLICSAYVCIASSSAKPQSDAAANPPQNTSFRMVAESEIKSLEAAGILADFSAQTGIPLAIEYKGPTDIKSAVDALADTPQPVDAYWAGSSLWLAGSSKIEPQSVMKTYVVLAVDPVVAQELGWDTQTGITATDVVEGIRAGKIKLAMTSASQSTPGAAFYLAMYTALTGDRVLTSTNLSDPQTVESMRTMLAGVERSAQSLDHLKKIFVADRVSEIHQYNAIVIYESLAMQMNQELISGGAPPMTVFYPEGATAIADAPIRYVDNDDPAKLAQYEQLVAFLSQPDIQQRIQELGWRTNPIGMALENADATLFNPAWGIDTTSEFREMVFPKPPAALMALNQYQTTFRKPSFTVYCLDTSGSMTTNGGQEQLIDAMDLLLDQERAAPVLLQATPDDVTVVYTFSDAINQLGNVSGNNLFALRGLSAKIANAFFGGGTALFSCAQAALQYIGENNDGNYAYAIIAMTDGESNQGLSADMFLTSYKQIGLNVPVFGIAFGSANLDQMRVFEQTGGAIYDGRVDILTAFRQAKGNN